MILNSLDDAAQAIAALQRQMRRLEAEVRTLQAAAADPDAGMRAFDAMLAKQLDALERAVAADMAFEDELAPPVRARRP